MSFANLPESLVSVLFSSWLTLWDLGRVDSAVCSRTHRPFFLRTAFSPTVPLQCLGESAWRPNASASTWILLRGASLPGLSLSTDSIDSPSELTSYLKVHGRALRFLEFPVVQALWSSRNAHIALYCPNLIRLDIASTLDKKDAARIANHCPLLEAITNAAVDEEAVTVLAKNCRNLRTFGFHAVTILSDALVSGLCKNAANMEQVLHSCELHTLSFKDSSIAILATHCPHLTTLDIKATFLTDASINVLAQRCRTLRTLCLRKSDVSGQALVHLASVCELRKLLLHGMRRVTYYDLNCILAHCPNLLSFSIDRPGYNGASYERIGSHCPLLEELVIQNCSVAREFGISAWRFQHLRRLVSPGVYGMAKEFAYTILRCCGRSLQYLDFSGMCADDEFMRFVAKHCGVLQALVAYSSNKVTDAGVLSVVHACAQLRWLDVRNCRGVTSEGVATARVLSPKLLISWRI